MDSDHVALLLRIEAFALDDPNSALTFSDRLARENNWSRTFARRVVGEYKRFVFLAMTAGHPVTPSGEVDQAWHLHLCYTESYWQRFCKEVLGRPLHHGPTKGGRTEHVKHVDWYERTLASYQRLFGKEPPVDIWPPVAERFRGATEVVRIDRRTHWVIPKPPCWPWLKMAAGALAAACLVTGCEEAFSGRIPIFDLRGPEFLTFYVVFVPAVLAGAAFLRWYLRGPRHAIGVSDLPKDPYTIACLAGGAAAAVTTACVSLAQRGLISARRGGKITLAPPPIVEPPDLHPLERTIFKGTGYGLEPFQTTRFRAKKATDEIEEKLQESGLYLTPRMRLAANSQALLLALVAPAVGIIKIFVGVARNKPVGFLVALTLLTCIAVFLLFRKRPLRTRLGDAALKLLKKENAGMANPSYFAQTPPLLPNDLAFAVGLFGIQVLLPTAGYNEFAHLFGPEPFTYSYSGTPGNGSGGNSSSGCSSGGGSGCGGGGGGCGSGCGGGCGGCGGGSS